MKQLKASFFIIGTIIGAGATSGKEVVVNFSKYGLSSLYFAIPVFVLYFGAIYLLLIFGLNHGECSATSVNKTIFKNQTRLANILTFIAFLITSSTMFAAINAIFNFEKYSLNYFILNIIFATICVFFVNKNLKIMKIINTIIVPIILISIFVVIFANISNNSSTILVPVKFGWLLMPFNVFVYVFKDIFLSYFVIIKTSSDLTKKQCLKISIISSFILTALMFIGIICAVKNPEILSFDLPYLELAKNISKTSYYLYMIVLLMAILTSLLASIYTLKDFFKTNSTTKSTIISVCLAIVFSGLGFSYFVEYTYPIIGVMGVYLTYLILPFKSFFKPTNKYIHNTGKKTKYNRCSHN